MKKIDNLTQEEIQKINEILKDEYYYMSEMPLKTGLGVEYQLFTKSHAKYSGMAVIKVYKYLCEIGIDIDPTPKQSLPIEHPFYFLDGEHLVRYIKDDENGDVVVCFANMDVPDTSTFSKDRLLNYKK